MSTKSRKPAQLSDVYAGEMALALRHFLHRNARFYKFFGVEEAQRPRVAASMMILQVIPGHSSNQPVPVQPSQLLRNRAPFVPVESLVA